MSNRDFNSQNLVILSCNAAKDFTQRVINTLNNSHTEARKEEIKLGKLNISIFPGGEPCVKIMENVREKNVHVFQCFRQTKLPIMCQDLTELWIVLDAINRAGASKISVYLPYLPFQRQERKVSGREPISARLIFDLIAISAGKKYHRLITTDMHSGAAAGFSSDPVDNLTAWPLWAMYIKNTLKLNPKKDIAIIAPDAGAAKRARKFADHFGCHFALIEKNRPKDKNKDAMVYYIVGAEEVKGKIAIIIDDMIATGGTLVQCSKLLRYKGAIAVYAFATHGLFNIKNEIPAEKRLYDAQIKVVTTDSIPEKFEGYFRSCQSWLADIISLNKQFADALCCNETGQSLSKIMASYEKNDFKLQIL